MIFVMRKCFRCSTHIYIILLLLFKYESIWYRNSQFFSRCSFYIFRVVWSSFVDTIIFFFLFLFTKSVILINIFVCSVRVRYEEEDDDDDDDDDLAFFIFFGGLSSFFFFLSLIMITPNFSCTI